MIERTIKRSKRPNRHRFLLIAAVAFLGALGVSHVLAQEISQPPDDFPNFQVTGHETTLQPFRNMFWLHHANTQPNYPGPGRKATFWDCWLVPASLWPDMASRENFRRQWKEALLARKIDDDGYVSSEQHAGFAHADGWPFPLFSQGGVGWVFSRINAAFYDDRYGIPLTDSADHFERNGFQVKNISHERGLTLQLSKAEATITSPLFRCDVSQVPLMRFDWEANGLGPETRASIQWMREGETDFPKDRSVSVTLPKNGESVYTHLWMHRHPDWTGKIVRLRLVLHGQEGGEVSIRSWIVTFDSRHVANQTTYLKGCLDYLQWTGDTDFLKQNMPRMRRVLDFTLKEFDVEASHCVRVPWVGHDGRSGSILDADGKRVTRVGLGIPGNYWDNLPFGGKECLTTIYLYDVLLKWASLEEAILADSSWQLGPDSDCYSPTFLREQARILKEANSMFWNEETGRFVASVDSDGVRHDYGFVFLNNEAIYYGYANEEQAASILSWLNGDRIVSGDTSQGEDIYFYRFGPRTTTRRNIDYTYWGWSQPEQFAFGEQIQDGGAVLGFAYHDIMARIIGLGPGNALIRLEQCAEWFTEVQKSGGYQNYYAQGNRPGKPQGGIDLGGLGLDKEFYESVLLPQCLLVGFAGFEADFRGIAIKPNMPEAWPDLSIDRICWQDQRIDLKLSKNRIEIQFTGPERTIQLRLPKGHWQISGYGKEESVTIEDSPTTWQTVSGQPVVLFR